MGKEKAEVDVGFEAVGLCGLDEAVEGDAGFGTAGMAGEEPVLPAHGEVPGGVLGQVVVGAQAAVPKKP